MERVLNQGYFYNEFLVALVKLFNSTPENQRFIREEKHSYHEKDDNGKIIKTTYSTWHSIEIGQKKGHIQNKDKKYFSGSYDYVMLAKEIDCPKETLETFC